MKTATIEAVILGHKNFGEKDKLIFFYTPEFGKIKVIAKGSRRINSKFTGHLETLSIVQASIYFGPRNIILTEINSTERIRPKNTLSNLKSALQIAEITNKLIQEEQTNENLHLLLQEAINLLTTTDKPQIITYAYIIKLLDQLGSLPDFREIRTNLPEKFSKFFNYVKQAPLSEIECITLDHKEATIVENFILKALQFTFDLNFSSLETFKTPRTLSNLSNNKSN